MQGKPVKFLVVAHFESNMIFLSKTLHCSFTSNPCTVCLKFVFVTQQHVERSQDRGSCKNLYVKHMFLNKSLFF